MDIAEIGRNHLRDALTGEMSSIVVHEWLDNKKPVEIFYRPITGIQQKQIEAMSANSQAEGVCMSVKVRALDKDGRLIFGNTPIESMTHDYNYTVLLKIFLCMSGGAPVEAERGELEKE